MGRIGNAVIFWSGELPIDFEVRILTIRGRAGHPILDARLSNLAF
jgi:hypothetical protein